MSEDFTVRNYETCDNGITVSACCSSLMVSGCGGYCPPNRHIGDRVSESAVVGEWRLTEDSLRNLTRDGFRREGAHRYTITFKADHTCEFASVRPVS